MQTTWQALIWKEWREHRWKIALLALASVGTWAALSLMVHDPHAMFTVAGGVTATFGSLAAVLLGIAAAAREQATGTVGFLQKLPASPRRAAAVKVAFAVLGIVVPVAITLAAVWLANGLLFAGQAQPNTYDQIHNTPLGIQNWYAAVAVTTIPGALTVLAWMLAFGVNRSDEIRAAATGFLAMVLAAGAFVLAAELLEGTSIPREASLAAAALPWGLVPLLDVFRELPGMLWATGVVVALVHGGFVWRYVSRFGRTVPVRLQTVERKAARTAVQSAADWLAPPRRSPLAAMAWKQFRESTPLAVLGGVLVLGLFVIVVIANRFESSLRLLSVSDLLEYAGFVWAMIGFAIALVAGLGVFLEDLRPELQGFWRSRPIPVGLWFAVKLMTGLLATIVPLLAGLAVAVLAAAALSGTNVGAEIGRNELLWAGGMILLQTGVYLAAFTAMTWLRQPIYAGIAATISPVLFMWVIEFCGRMLEPTTAVGSIGMVTVIGCVAGAGLLTAAWQAVKHDWGWKH
ncbi:MAG: hypothetical protein CMJ58_22185 [Planctomycetaceae bacterium]|nr:hypothetical protein [Planctomycetaceae bacterium]